MTDNSTAKNFGIDSALPEFTITVDRNVYSLRYDFGAFYAYEKQTGINPLSTDFSVSVDNLAELLFAGLQRSHPEVTVDKVREWLTPKSTEGLIAFVVDAYVASFPVREPEAAGAPADPPTA